MKTGSEAGASTRALLLRHYQAYPKLEIADVFKFIFQSAFGCEHFVSSEADAAAYIRREHLTAGVAEAPKTGLLDGAYSRVHLSWLDAGLSPETLARLFCLSARKEPDGRALLLEKLQVAGDLIANGELPLKYDAFDRMLGEWSAAGYPAVHHSDTFRAAYHPAYRVIANAYVEYLELLAKIDRLLSRGPVTVAIEGGSASGKSTFSATLQAIYGCNVFHMDDFFLRPEQRTAARYAEVGGNVDRERFAHEVLRPLSAREAVCYRPFDCSRQMLGEPITVKPKPLTVVEGVYSMHPAFGRYYDLSLFLDIDAEQQRARILKRNSPALATRFFAEWIPLENAYFAGTDTKNRCDLSLALK